MAQPSAQPEMLTIAQTTQARLRKMDRMLLFLIACVVLALVRVITSALTLRAGPMPVSLGWMSERWLVEYRASHLN